MDVRRYANRTLQTVTAGTAPGPSTPTDPTSNQMTGYTYDADGNLSNDGSNSLTYDAENRLATSSSSLGSGTYSYDGKSLRAKKVSGSTTTVYIFAGPKVIAEYQNGAAPGAPTREYIYSGAVLLAKIEGSTTTYYHSDHISKRLLTDVNGNSVGQQGHFPFGEQWYAQSTTTKWAFTTYERDAESGNDYALARYHVNRLGRFLSIDPAGLGSVDATSPQTWNRYSYVSNDPLDLVDPLGLCDEVQDGTLDASSDRSKEENRRYRIDKHESRGGGGCGGDVSGGDWTIYVTVVGASATVTYTQNYSDWMTVNGWMTIVNQGGTPGGTGGAGGGRKATLTSKDQKRYNEQKQKALKDILNPDCVAFCISHGIDPVALAHTIENQQAFNGSGSSITQEAAQTGITDPSQTVAQGFQRPGVKAAASLNGTDVYFRSGGFWFIPNGNITENTIEHEALHNYFGMEGASADDSYVQHMLGVDINYYDTTNINQALKDHHCTH